MEILILICLILVIVLLVHDKVTISIKKADKTISKKDVNSPTIMGPAKTEHSKLLPTDAIKGQIAVSLEKQDNFEPEIKEQSPLDLEEEQEEWELNQEPQNPDDYVGQGVSHTEFKTVFVLLQKDNISEKEKKEAAGIVQKLQGTEMFNLLESTMDGASVKIAKLLDRSLNASPQQDPDDFDIREFV
ncbi:conjugal transfer protein TraD [Sphingobacterium sp.]|uniref:conjugal transfer protein TraD n=1 Tax=Sphingobacterium sp. TaxID=341027 RepID=UPI00258D4C9A|nr:conjugal transfer protein TraD [Sphingobacterium sp.]WET69078.1 MAG: conjugal transfer protein TraD [Sphingobacterium sp.]